MNRNLLVAVLALTSAGSWNRCSAQDLPSLEVFYSALPAQAEPPAINLPLRSRPGYLAAATGRSGEKLFQFLHTATAYPARGGGDYLRSKKYMFSRADNTGCGGAPGVTCLYSQVCAKGASEHGEDYKEQGDANGDGFVDSDGMNAEHSWPQGFFNGALPMRADLHHIFPTFMKPNNTRGSSPFGVVARAEYVTKNGTKFDGSVFEPADAVKGDIARAILYFVVRYYDQNIRDGVNYKEFWASRVPMFLEWDRRDPPDAAERGRNDLIEAFQGNRNPFVDDVSLAGRVSAQTFQSH
ncbi:MAG: endonuclease [Elusimicrobia bacterium]|nr:endonuclease [Elusimicrobiota bacterium]